jgi:Homeobox domain.
VGSGQFIPDPAHKDANYLFHTTMPPSQTRSSPAINTLSGNNRTARHWHTCKHISNVQLVMLEDLFHKNAHPTCDERKNLATAGGM